MSATAAWTTTLLSPSEGFGDCIITEHHDPETGDRSLTIDQADPRILISGELLHQLTINIDPAEAFARFASLTCRGDIAHCGDCDRNHDWTGAILRIQGSNRMVVYRITGRADVPGGYRDPTWLAEWPD